MSNIWSRQQARLFDSVGSFAIERGKPVFKAWPPEGRDLPCDAAPANDPVAVDIPSLEAKAFADGYEQGRRAVALEMAAERDAIARLAETLQVLRPEPTDALAALLAETVERLVRQVAGAVAVDGALLLRRAQAAAELIGEETGPSKLRVHPDDAGFLVGADLPLAVVADASLARGSVVLETASGWIEDGPAVRLDRLRAALDRMGAFS